MRPYRKEKVASAIRQIVSEAIAHRLSDPRIEPLTTVTRVEMSGDLLIARVYFTVSGGDASERRTLAGLRHATGYLQRMIAEKLSLRQCPELRLDVDKGAKEAKRTMELLTRNLQDDPGLAQMDSEEPADSELPGATQEWEGDSRNGPDGDTP